MKFQPVEDLFFQKPTIEVAKNLLNTFLIREFNDTQLVGKIVETEAYIGEDDPACHAAPGKTKRNAIMYDSPGFAYVYFIYGMYNCVNIVTEEVDFPAAVLIRAIEPIVGIEKMQALRKIKNMQNIANGPGKLCQAMQIDRELNGTNLRQPPLWIAQNSPVKPDQILTTRRIGITKATEKPWRFCITDSPYVSHPRFR